jgi:hypothetical protein
MNNGISFFKLFFEVWIRPRKVIREVVTHDSGYKMWSLIFAFNIIGALDPQYYISFLNRIPPLGALLAGEILYSLLAIAYFFYFTWFVYKIGSLWGGSGSFREVKAAYAWCLPPAIVGMALNQLGGVPVWMKIFSGVTNGQELMFGQPMLIRAFLSVLYLLLTFWSLYPAIVNVAEVHRISVGKVIVIGLIVMAPIMVLAMGVGFIMGFSNIQAH